MFHDLRANVWMLGTPQEPEHFETYAHRKIERPPFQLLPKYNKESEAGGRVLKGQQLPM